MNHADYWNRPVAPHGDSESSILIIGLAPGLHGANKTGIPFTGDASGYLLNKVLAALGLVDRVRITNAVKCLPISNLPSAQESTNCHRFLRSEINEHSDRATSTSPRVLFVLGGAAHRNVIKVSGLRQRDYTFGHGRVHPLKDNVWIVDSYHCSRYNTQTGRLTEEMFQNAMNKALQLSNHGARARAHRHRG